MGVVLVRHSVGNVANRLTSWTWLPQNLHPKYSGVFFLFVVSLVSSILQISQNTFGYWANPQILIEQPSAATHALSLLQGWGYLGCLQAGTLYFQSTKVIQKFFLFAIVLTLCVIGILNGGREPALMPWVAFTFGALITSFTYKRLISLSLTSVIALLILTPAISLMRDTIVSIGSRSVSTTSVPNSNSPLQSPEPSDLLGNSYDFVLSISNRLNRIADIHAITTKVPSEVPYVSTKDSITSLYESLIPRVLWNEKPSNTATRDMSVEFYNVPVTTLTSSAITPFGDLWRRGGITSVTTGSFVLGMIYALVERRAPRTLLSVPSCFAPLLAFPLIFKGESDAIPMPAELLSICVSAFLAWQLLQLIALSRVRCGRYIGVVFPKLVG